MKIHLLIIDPQNDFANPQGKLYVPGSEYDVERLSQFIDKNKHRLSKIHLTLDSHHWTHIAHPIFWRDENNTPPAPFTIIELKDITQPSPKWSVCNKEFAQSAHNYIAQLENHQRYKLCIWPPHCIIGTWGHTIPEVLQKSLRSYEEQFKPIEYILKGQNLLTEHYSAIKADVGDANDPTTQINLKLLQELNQADKIIIAGEALSHCVANTVNDMIEELGHDFSQKLTILTDTTSTIPGFEATSSKFLEQMENLGVSLKSSKDPFGE